MLSEDGDLVRVDDPRAIAYRLLKNGRSYYLPEVDLPLVGGDRPKARALHLRKSEWGVWGVLPTSFWFSEEFACGVALAALAAWRFMQ